MTENKMALSIPKAAKTLDLSETFVRRLVYEKRLPAVKVGRRWIIPVKSLELWLNEQAMRGQ